MSESSKWDFESLRAHKQGVRYQIQCDIDKLDMAIGLLSEVNETFAQAFYDSLDNAEKEPSTETSAGTIPIKMARSISEVKGIMNVLKLFKEKV